MDEPHHHFSTKFYLGIVLIVFSFVLAKIANVLFIIYFTDSTLRNISVVSYILTWPMLFIGAWLVGKEYSQKIKRYLSYQFYQESIKKKTKQAKLNWLVKRKLKKAAKNKN